MVHCFGSCDRLHLRLERKKSEACLLLMSLVAITAPSRSIMLRQYAFYHEGSCSCCIFSVQDDWIEYGACEVSARGR